MQNFHVGLVGHYGRFIQKKVGWDMSMDQRTNISQEKKPLKRWESIHKKGFIRKETVRG